MACEGYPTQADALRFKENSDAETEFVESNSDTFVTPEGQTKLTISGVTSKIAQVNPPTPVGDGIWLAGKVFNGYNEYMIYNGEAYSPLPATVLPYTVGAAPDLGFVYQIQLNDHSLLANLDAADAHPASSILSTSGFSVQKEIDDIGIDIGELKVATEKNRTNLSTVFNGRVNLEARANRWGTKCFNILGDSISHGAGADETYWNSYAFLLTRMINIEYNKANIGFVSIEPDTSSSQGFHDVTVTGTFFAQQQAAASNLINGFGRKSGSSGDLLTIKAPTATNFFEVWFQGVDGGGQFTVTVDGSLAATIDTDQVSPEGFLRSDLLNMVDSGTGSTDIVIEPVGDGDVTILGISYVNEASALEVNNFSQSGRRLVYTDESVIDAAVTGATSFFLALGHNDAADSESTPGYAAEFTQRIDWIIQYANTSGTKVYILDFNWLMEPDTHVRSELKRASDEINSASYLNFPDHFKMDGGIPDAAYLTTTLKLFIDGSHPSIRGHEFLAEAISNEMGLSCTSKFDANRSDTVWNPFQITGSVINSFPSTPDLLFSWKISNDILNIKGYVGVVGGGVIPLGTYPIVSSFTQGWVSQTQEIATYFNNTANGYQPTQLLIANNANAGFSLKVLNDNDNTRAAAMATVTLLGGRRPLVDNNA